MPRKKSPVTRPGIDPGTFPLVAQHLNHYTTPGPWQKDSTYGNIRAEIFTYLNKKKLELRISFI
jgi:hypothetical protein